MIGDEEMIDIAENSLVKIAEALLAQNVTIPQLYGGVVITEYIEDQRIDLLSPLHFLEGLKQLNIAFTELEVACLMNVLAKP